jgi:hypothetical protein
MAISTISNNAIASLAASKLTGQVPLSTGVSGVLPDANAPSGSVLQVVQSTNQNTNNFSSSSYQLTSNTVSITPALTNSRFLIIANMYGGYENHDTAVAFNFSDSLVGNTTAIAPDSTTGAGTNRTGGYFGITSWAANSTVDDWFIGHANGQFLYTPSYQNTNARTFGVIVKTSLSFYFRENMSQRNADDSRDLRLRSSITVMEIAA